MLRVRRCACDGGGGPVGPSAMVPIRGERRAGRLWLLLRNSKDWGLLCKGLHFFTGAGAGASEAMSTCHLFLQENKTNSGMQPPYLARQLSEGELLKQGSGGTPFEIRPAG